jgi:hypothetical protein
MSSARWIVASSADLATAGAVLGHRPRGITGRYVPIDYAKVAQVMEGLG